MPSKIHRNASVFGEVSSNIHKRFARYKRNTRRLARIDLYKNLKTKSGKDILFYNFNYEYMYVGFGYSSAIEDHIEIVLSDQLTIKGEIEYEKDNNINDGKVAVLYRVTNLHELLTNKEFRPLLEKWVKSYRDYCVELERNMKHKEKSNEDELDEMEYIWGGNENA